MTNYRADYLGPKALSNLPFKSLEHDVIIHERVTLVGIENISYSGNDKFIPAYVIHETLLPSVSRSILRPRDSRCRIALNK
jgi:hypothetical protein